jgi:hypothetical protein
MCVHCLAEQLNFEVLPNLFPNNALTHASQHTGVSAQVRQQLALLETLLQTNTGFCHTCYGFRIFLGFRRIAHIIWESSQI